MLGMHTGAEMRTYVNGIIESDKFKRNIMELIEKGASMNDIKFKLEAEKAAGNSITVGHSSDNLVNFLLELLDDPECQWSESFDDCAYNGFYLELQDELQRSESFTKQMTAALDDQGA
jgi:hypothetical protein